MDGKKRKGNALTRKIDAEDEGNRNEEKGGEVTDGEEKEDDDEER